MTHPLTPQDCLSTPASQRCDAELPDNPQCTLNVHFGMLLGVDELRTEQGFHLGRSRRHQRLLHGTGVVAGYAVSLDDKTFDLRVKPGLAVDALGRDLVLEQDQCLNLVQWWLKHQQDEAFDDLHDVNDATFDVDIVVCYSNCLGSPVPAIAEPCAGNASDIAYSRVCETVTLSLVRRPVPTEGEPAPPLAPWPTSRQALAERLAARDIAAPDPVKAEDLCLPLACLRGLHLKKDANGWQVTFDRIDLAVRPLLLSTAVLQELLWPGLAQAPGLGGPRVLPDGIALTDTGITLRFDQPLAPASVTKEAFSVSEFDAAQGWRLCGIQAVDHDASGPQPTVKLTLSEALSGQLVRVAVIGHGPTPLLGENLLPAAAPTAFGDGQTLTTTIHRG